MSPKYTLSFLVAIYLVYWWQMVNYRDRLSILNFGSGVDFIGTCNHQRVLIIKKLKMVYEHYTPVHKYWSAVLLVYI